VGGLDACGVSTEAYTRTLHERDQLRDRAGRAELEAAAQRRQADELRAAVTEQQQTTHALQARVTELEAQTADQSLAQEALGRQLRSVTTEREELLLKLDELKAPPPTSPASSAASGALRPAVEPGAQRLAAELRDIIEAGHLTTRPLADGLVLQLAASFLFVSDKAVFTVEGQQVLSTVVAALSATRARRLQIRMGVPQEPDRPLVERDNDAKPAVFNRGMMLLRQFEGNGQLSPELVMVVDHEGGASKQVAPSPSKQTIRLGDIQIVVEWSAAP
jgi:outer membrane protein OmpA-like peptidoglycan-associated protein